MKQTSDPIETKVLRLARGRYTARLYKTVHREGGMRIIVTGPDGLTAFDTRDCFDLGNANSLFAAWLAQQPAAQPQPQEAA